MSYFFLKKKTELQFTRLKDNFISIAKKDTHTSFCGYLLDIDTNEPIVDAFINNGEKSVISDEDGFFQFENMAISAPFNNYTYKL